MSSLSDYSPKINSELLRCCSKCGQEYPLTAEYWYKRDNGYRTDCKACCREQRRRYHADNPGKNYEIVKRWNAAHPDKKREQGRRWSKANPDKIRQKERRWRAENPDRAREKDRRKYYANLEAARGRKRRYGLTHPDKIREQTHRRKARKRDLPCHWTNLDEQSMFEAWNYRCAYCGNQQGLFDNLRMSADHYIPLSASEQCPGTVPWNMVPACKACNSSKHNNLPHEWLAKKFGPHKAKQIAKRIEAYLASLQIRIGHHM